MQAALGFTATNTSFFFASFGALSVILQLGPGPRLIDTLGDRRSSNIGIALSLCGFLLVPLIHSIWTMLPTFLLFGIGMSIARPALSSILADGAPENQRGTILGVSSALDNLSGVAMPPLSTGLLGRYGPAWAGVTSSLFAFVALLMGLGAQRRENADIVDHTAEAAAK
jgi:MFS family permease